MSLNDNDIPLVLVEKKGNRNKFQKMFEKFHITMFACLTVLPVGLQDGLIQGAAVIFVGALLILLSVAFAYNLTVFLVALIVVSIIVIGWELHNFRVDRNKYLLEIENDDDLDELVAIEDRMKPTLQDKWKRRLSKASKSTRRRKSRASIIAAGSVNDVSHFDDNNNNDNDGESVHPHRNRAVSMASSVGNVDDDNNILNNESFSKSRRSSLASSKSSKGLGSTNRRRKSNNLPIPRFAFLLKSDFDDHSLDQPVVINPKPKDSPTDSLRRKLELENAFTIIPVDYESSEIVPSSTLSAKPSPSSITRIEVNNHNDNLDGTQEISAIQQQDDTTNNTTQIDYPTFTVEEENQIEELFLQPLEIKPNHKPTNKNLSQSTAAVKKRKSKRKKQSTIHKIYSMNDDESDSDDDYDNKNNDDDDDNNNNNTTNNTNTNNSKNQSTNRSSSRKSSKSRNHPDEVIVDITAPGVKIFDIHDNDSDDDYITNNNNKVAMVAAGKANTATTAAASATASAKVSVR